MYQDKPNKDSVYAQPRAYEFTYYLSDCVQDSHEYHELLQLLDAATENDVVRIVINNYGGEAGTCIQIVDHIRNCRGTVVGHLSGNAFSAAGVIFIACQVHELAEHSFMMIHTAVGGTAGKYSDMQDYIVASNKRTQGLYQDVFKHFLTEEEIDKIIYDGKEMWILKDEIEQRLKKRQSLLQAEGKANQQKAEKEFEEQMFGPEIQFTKEQLVASKIKREDIAKAFFGEVDLVMVDGKITVVPVDLPENE